MLDLAESGIRSLLAMQREALTAVS